jgi:hypothetical protein
MMSEKSMKEFNLNQFNFTRWPRHGFFHTWDNWKIHTNETQSRECLKCGKLQVRSIDCCSIKSKNHVWQENAKNWETNESGMRNVALVYTFICMKCAKVKVARVPVVKDEKFTVQIL